MSKQHRGSNDGNRESTQNRISAVSKSKQDEYEDDFDPYEDEDFEEYVDKAPEKPSIPIVQQSHKLSVKKQQQDDTLALRDSKQKQNVVATSAPSSAEPSTISSSKLKSVQESMTNSSKSSRFYHFNDS